MKNPINKTMLLAKGSVLVLSLIFITGCDWFKTKKSPPKEASKKAKTLAQNSGVVLCSINGKAVIRESDFLENMSQMLLSNPYFRGASADSIPIGIKRKFLDELVKQELIMQDATKNSIAQDPDYIKAYDDMIKLVKKSLTIQFFEKKIYENIKVTDTDLKNHYNDNKAKFVKVAGGVLVSGAKFDSQENASKFLASVKNDVKNFDKLAKNNTNAQFTSFGRVSQETSPAYGTYDNVPPRVKTTALAVKKFPSVETVKAEKETWVISVTDKKDTIFFSLDEIKPQIEGIVKNNQFKEKLDKHIKELRANMTIDINEEYFQGSNASGPGAFNIANQINVQNPMPPQNKKSSMEVKKEKSPAEAITKTNPKKASLPKKPANQASTAV